MQVWLRDFVSGAPSYFVAAGTAALAAVTVERSAYGLLPMAIVPIYLTYRAYEMYAHRLEEEFKRKQWLQEQQVAAPMDVQNAQARRDTAASSLQEAQTNLANQTGLISAARADLDRTIADLDSARAAAGRLEAQWRSAMVDVDRTKIRSPVDGVVVGRNITEGQTLATGLEAKTLFVIAGDLGHMEINAAGRRRLRFVGRPENDWTANACGMFETDRNHPIRVWAIASGFSMRTLGIANGTLMTPMPSSRSASFLAPATNVEKMVGATLRCIHATGLPWAT